MSSFVPRGRWRVARTNAPRLRFSPAVPHPIRARGSRLSSFAPPLSGANLAHRESRNSVALPDSWRIAHAGGRCRKARCGMTAEKLPRFDIAALKRLAGGAFVRGEAYHREGRVEILAIEPRRVLARVMGTEDYRVNLLGQGETIKGECDCPAFDDYGFCKHMVATALSANERDRGPQSAGAHAPTRIPAPLSGKPNAALVEMIVELAERDRTLFRKLEIASAADGADDKTLAVRLNKAIDQATATRGYVEYGEAGGWAAGVDEALDSLDALNSTHDRLLFKLAERAIDRIESAIESVDDSDGECGALLERARDMHISAARGAGPDSVALARNLYERETGDGYGTFDGAAWLYADVLGEAGLAEYRKLATEAWQKLPRLTGGGRQKPQGDYDGLSGILDRFAELEGDVEARIALRAKDCRRPGNTLSSLSSASGTGARMRRCAGPRKGCGRSRTALRTRASSSSRPTFL